MTSPTATARPWATPVRAPRRDPAKKTRSRTGTAGPGLRDAPAEGGQCITDLRQHPTFRADPPSAPDIGAPSGASDLRPGLSIRRDRFAGAKRPAAASGGGAAISRSSGPQANRADRREAVLTDAAGICSFHRARASCRTVCTATAEGLSPAAGPTRCATRRSGRRRSAATRGRYAGAQYGKQGCRRPPPGWTRRSAYRASGAVCETAPPNSGGARLPGSVPDRRDWCPIGPPVIWWAMVGRRLRLAVGRDVPLELFNAGGLPAWTKRGNRTRRVATSPERGNPSSSARMRAWRGRDAGDSPLGRTNGGTPALVGSYENLAGGGDAGDSAGRDETPAAPRWTNGEPSRRLRGRQLGDRHLPSRTGPS